ncbi:hypothetical protein Tco_0884968 [Tanacetum coccineum]
MALKLMAKEFQLNNFTPTNNNQRSSSNPCNSQIAQSGNLVVQHAIQNQGIQNIGNQNGLSVISGIANQHGNGNVVAAWAEGNGINGNLIRCYNCQGVDHYASNCIVKPRKRDAAYLQKQILTKLSSMTQTDQLSVEQGGGTVEQHSATIEKTRAYNESLFHNLAAEVEKVNSVNRKMKETNVDLTTELARYKNQEKCFEISQEKYEKLERLVPSCFVIFDLECLSLSFDFVFMSEIFKSLSFSLDRLCRLAILCLDQHAHTLHHLESLLTISV